jgi:hypothetical protein
MPNYFLFILSQDKNKPYQPGEEYAFVLEIGAIVNSTRKQLKCLLLSRHILYNDSAEASLSSDKNTVEACLASDHNTVEANPYQLQRHQPSLWLLVAVMLVRHASLMLLTPARHASWVLSIPVQNPSPIVQQSKTQVSVSHTVLFTPVRYSSPLALTPPEALSLLHQRLC